LQRAIRNQLIEVADVLLAAGAALDRQDSNGTSALHAAAMIADPVAIEMLLANGASVNLPDRAQKTAWDLLGIRLRDARTRRAATPGEQQLSRLLLENAGARSGMLFDAPLPPLQLAMQDGQIDELKGFADAINKTNALGRTALHLAAEQGDAEMITRLLQLKVDINAVDHEKRTALHVAVTRGHEEAVRRLLAARARNSLRDRRGFTPLDLALRQTEIAEALREAGAKHGKHEKPLTLTAVRRQLAELEVATAIDGQRQVQPARDSRGLSIFQRACFTGSAKAVKALLAAGYTIREETSDGASALHVAGSADVARILVDEGLKVDAKSSRGYRPLHTASRYVGQTASPSCWRMAPPSMLWQIQGRRPCCVRSPTAT
jgi:ankyrin repeat protein